MVSKDPDGKPTNMSILSLTLLLLDRAQVSPAVWIHTYRYDRQQHIQEGEITSSFYSRCASNYC